MSLKRKFVISSVLMFVVPLVVIVLLSLVLFFVYQYLDPSGALSLFQFGEHVREAPPQARLFPLIPIWIVLIVAVVAGSCAAITLYLSRSILPPLRDLRTAVDQVREGNLNFEVLSSPVSEIDDLCRSFDDMRKRLKEGVQATLEAEQGRAILMANLSHDLRTPVTSIKGYVEGILDGVANTPEKNEKYLVTIRQKVDVIERLLDDMSALSELELGKMRFHFEIRNIVPFVRDIAEEYRFDLEAEGAALDIRLPSEELPVMMDREKLRRVFQNVLSNAVKYRADAPLRVQIEAEAADGGVYLSVSDNGKGIPEAELKKVFEGFYRGDPSRNSLISGNGLGLSISKQIVEHHHGKIWIKSEVAVGTTVNMFFPVRSVEQAD
ncbi:HAMP domain-containing histidine kinase [Oscillospiraceae bacterium OttesenSCG-928-G22]|nr:HAMP domain-containing histidine kinase [Oscillospiraceae bacterium OttesenSCG-928-G22]